MLFTIVYRINYQIFTKMDELNKRIVELMLRFNHSKSSLANALGVSLPLITHVTTGRNKPGIDILQKVLSNFPQVDPRWLLLGEGNMLKAPVKTADHTAVLLKISSLNQLITSSLEVNETMLQYHKLLLDEVLHLREMSSQIQHSSDDLNKLKQELDDVKNEIRKLDQ